MITGALGDSYYFSEHLGYLWRMESRVGLVIPTLGNRQELTLKLIDSLKTNETFFEIVVVFPSSRREIVESIFGSLSRVKFVECDESGLTSAIRKGLREVRSEYWNWIGDDDIVKPTGYNQMFQALKSDTTLSFTFSNCEYIDSFGNIIGVNRPRQFGLIIAQWGPNVIPQPSCLFRKENSLALDLPSLKYELAMDLDLVLKLRQNGEGRYVNVTSSQYRWHLQTLTNVKNLESGLESLSIRLANRPSWLGKALVLLSFFPTQLLLKILRALFIFRSRRLV